MAIYSQDNVTVIIYSTTKGLVCQVLIIYFVTPQRMGNSSSHIDVYNSTQVA